MDQSKNLKPKFLRVESNKFPYKEKKKTKQFTIDSSDLTNYLSNNKFSRSRSGTPQINPKYKMSNSKMKKKFKNLNEKSFLNKFSKNPNINNNLLKTPTRTINHGIIKFFLKIRKFKKKNISFFIWKNSFITGNFK